jgi:hypothetical protein
MLRYEAVRRDVDAFQKAHTGAGDSVGWEWFHANERATGVLMKFGYDVSDERVKAIASLTVRAVLDEDWTKRIRQTTKPEDKGLGELASIYSDELEIPFKTR